MKKKLFFIILIISIFFVSLWFILSLFLSTSKIDSRNNLGNEINNDLANQNKNVNTERGNDAKYKIFYKTKPKISFGENNSEIVSFETLIPTRYVLEYGDSNKYGKLKKDNNFKKFHEITLDGLQSGEKYYYKISIFDEYRGYNEEFSSSFYAVKNNPDFSFIVLGDSRPISGWKQPKVFSKIIKQITDLSPDFVVMAGDMVQLSNANKVTYREAEDAWNGFLDVIHPLNSSVPWYFVVGNHDEPDQKNSIQRFRDIWTFPQNGGGLKEWHNEIVYSFSYGSSLFVIINTEEPDNKNSISDEQYDWIKKTIDVKSYEHIFIFSHRPINGSKRKIDMKKNQDFHKLFIQNNVSAVFSGHDHLYCKNKIDNMYYIISGGAGSPLYEKLCDGLEISKHHFVLVKVENENISVLAIDENGEIMDEFSFKK